MKRSPIPAENLQNAVINQMNDQVGRRTSSQSLHFCSELKKKKNTAFKGANP